MMESMKESGELILMEVRDTEKEFRFGMTEACMKVNGKTTEQRV